MGTHFLTKRKPWPRDGRTWIMLRGFHKVRSRTDYLLVIDRCLFQIFWSRTCTTIQTTTWSLVVSGGQQQRNVTDTWVGSDASPCDSQGSLERQNDCLWRFGGKYPGHCGGRDTADHGYCWRPGDLLTPGSRRAGYGRGINGMCSSSAARSGQSSISTSDSGNQRQGLQSSPSSLLTRLSPKRRGSMCRGSTKPRLTTPPPPPE